MREIKFRAWDKNKKNFIGYSEYVVYPNSGEVAEMVSYDAQSDKLSVNHEAVLEQFTGLHDKNGKEIYEGDIVQFQHFPYQKGVVSFEGFGFNVEGFWDSSYDCPSYAFSEGNNYEVIGNIHENPELLVEIDG
ncbi:YopX family protein [Fructobacillus americanaquae]|uniref:YopX family protein n=1 Tax=Fructobacillus americanaquae TaxID=2940302 RepID=A0ABY5BZU5_9LACO|nr:YopX family protein [Fructobacillus americanaquae]USS92015.1 YopX family protein [Fructobacillus americanaquae]